MNLQIRVVISFVVLLSGILTCGCASRPPSADSEPFITSYRNGLYQQALDQAEARAKSAGDGLARHRAALMAGLSAYALRRPDAAERWLNPLVGNTNDEIAGTAGWTLAMIAADRGNNVRAAALGSAAGARLKDDDAARAHTVAAEAYARLGRTTEAKEQQGLAALAARDPALRAAMQGAPASSGVGPTSAVLAKPPTGQYVIQLGAFATRSNAEQAAAAAAGAAARAALPAPVVVISTNPQTGRTLFAAQIGPYPDRPSAESALRRCGLKGTVMLAHP